MFDYESMIKRAIKFFPTWTDIRKRYKKSNGGKLLSSITEESLNIKNAIQEYKDYYFLDRKNPDDIVDYCYSTSIGIIDDLSNLKVIYNDIELKNISNLNNFLANTKSDTYFYENGKIYINQNKFITNKIKIYYKDAYLNFDLEKTHIWNIYDEFACFIGIERHEDETNKELYERMLYYNLNKPNSSLNGLKHGIISELMIYEPDIEENEIQIEKLNETSLRKPYEKFNELLEFLNKINRDVYKWKRWDLDFWEYDFENYSIEYLPYKWDEALSHFQNGIGYNDDLKVILSNNINETNAKVTFYKKDKETLLSYIRKKDIYKNITFTFKTYSNKLKPINIKYLIKASPLRLLSPSFISLNVYEQSNVTENINIENIFSIGNNVSKIENSKIIDTYPYRLKFIPNNKNYNIEIYKCNLIYRNRTTKEIVESINLIKKTDGFTINASGNLIDDSSKKTIKNINSMISSSNLYNLDNDNGFSIRNGYTVGQGAINVNGYGKNNVFYTYECKESSLDKSYIIHKNCIWKNDKLYLRTDVTSTKTVEIEIVANKLSFDIELNNNLLVYQYNFNTNNYDPEEISGPNATWSSEESPTPRKIKILISSVSSDSIILSNFSYSKYSIEFNVSNGVLSNVNNKIYLPNEIYNILFISLKSYSTYSPIINSVYIGEDIESNSYTTDIVYYKNNCERIFDIKCNCKVNLIKLNSSNTPISVINDYNSSCVYKGLSDNSYIRLNLDEWERIDAINTSAGNIEYIEESGKIFYNLKLKNNESISYITVKGSKKIPATTITLEDIIKIEFPNFNTSKDRVYCSKLLKGIIVSITGENSFSKIFKIKKEYLNKDNAYKYEFKNIPSDLGVIWGINENSISDSFSIESDFEYISFYSANSIIHTATNEYNLFLNETKNIKIVNNFSPFLNTDILNYYTVEPYVSENNIKIKFYGATDTNKSFEELNDWSIGLKNIYIKYDTDLFDNNMYEEINYTVKDNVKLNTYIPINDSYELTNNNILYTYKYQIIPPVGSHIIYKTYDATNETKDLIIDEIITIDNYFIKLKYANVDKIIFIKEYYNLKDYSEYDNYSLLGNEGIILWNNYEHDKDKNITVHIRYTYKKQIALSYDYNTLYDIIPYNINAYKELSTYVIKNMKNGQVYNLNNLQDSNISDLIYVSCEEPSFEARIENKYLTFNKYVEENKLLVKTGYYYINGKEYYLFSNNDKLGIDTYSEIDYKNISFNNGDIQTYKSTNNYVRNSSMLLSGMNNIYNFDYTNDTKNNSSNFNKFTACDSFNSWNSFCCKLKLITKDNFDDMDYLINDIALEFIFLKDFGYAFVDITNNLYDNSYISFISYGIDTYIGVEEKYENLKFPQSLNIDIKYFIDSKTENKIFNIKKENDKKYYLVIRKQINSVYKNCILDDIVITTTYSEAYNSHIKNIDLLELDFIHYRSEKSTYRMYITPDDNWNNHYAGLCSDGKIKTMSNINWGLTTIFICENKEDFAKCKLENLKLGNGYVQSTTSDFGYITTPPIYLKNLFSIKKIFFKINNINTEEMSNFYVCIYTCNKKDGNYFLLDKIRNNYGFINGYDLNEYLVIKLEIPKNKIIDNITIYSEYKSIDSNPLLASTEKSGYILSKIFDTQECLNYKIKNVSISDVSNIEDIEIYLRSCSDKYSADVWNSWKIIKLDENFNLKEETKFENSRFFQIKIFLKANITYVTLNYIELEVDNS